VLGWGMFRRIILFLAINCLIVLTISVILSVFNVRPYITRYGLNFHSLMLFCLIWGMVGALISLALSRKMAKWMMRVKLIDGSMEDYAKLYRTVERLARHSGLPDVPEVGVFASPDINAFATGPTKRRSLVAISTALLERMDDHELEAILGHEISHIANGDMVTMTLIQGVVNAFVMFLARIASYALSSLGRDQRGNSRPSYSNYHIMTFLFEILFMVLGSLLVAFFSRHREFRADRGGALLSRREYMVAALEKLKMAKTERTTVPPSMNAMMISIPHKEGVLRLFSTHPPIEQRIARLRDS